MLPGKGFLLFLIWRFWHVIFGFYVEYLSQLLKDVTHVIKHDHFYDKKMIHI